MSSRRVQKVAEAIREVVSMSILTELQDPRVRDVTVTGVEASGDLRYAKVMVSVMGDETRQNLTLRGLQSAAGFLQSKIADRIDLRYTPRLTFVLDQGVKHSIAVAQILREVLARRKARGRCRDRLRRERAGTGLAAGRSAAARPQPAHLRNYPDSARSGATRRPCFAWCPSAHPTNANHQRSLACILSAVRPYLARSTRS